MLKMNSFYVNLGHMSHKNVIHIHAFQNSKHKNTTQVWFMFENIIFNLLGDGKYKVIILVVSTCYTFWFFFLLSRITIDFSSCSSSISFISGTCKESENMYVHHVIIVYIQEVNAIIQKKCRLSRTGIPRESKWYVASTL